MRRILAMFLIVFIGFWGVFWFLYGVVPSVRAAVNGFTLDIVGPTVFNTVSTVYLGIINTVGVPGLAAIVLTSGFVVGIFTHKMLVGSDWRIRRWAAHRTSRDLGTTGVTQLPSSPLGATTRPEAKKPVIPQEQPKPVILQEEPKLTEESETK